MHTSFQQLINYLEDRLSAEQITEVSLHLACCPECRRALALAGQFLTNTRGGRQRRGGNRFTPLPPHNSALATVAKTYPPPTIFPADLHRYAA